MCLKGGVQGIIVCLTLHGDHFRSFNYAYKFEYFFLLQSLSVQKINLKLSRLHADKSDDSIFTIDCKYFDCLLMKSILSPYI